MSRIFSFSIKPKDTESIAIIETLQRLSIKKGIKFSYMVIEGLKLYMEREGIKHG